MFLLRFPVFFWLPWFALVLVGAVFRIVTGHTQIRSLVLVGAAVAIPSVLISTLLRAPESREISRATVGGSSSAADGSSLDTLQESQLLPKGQPSAPPRSATSSAPPVATAGPSLGKRIRGMVDDFLRPEEPVAVKPAVEAPKPPSLPTVVIANSTPAPPLPTPQPVVVIPTGEEFMKAHQMALALIKDQNGAGSGFIASQGGRTYLFTNIHVAAGMPHPEITLINGARLTPVAAEAAVGHDIMRFRLKDDLTQSLEVDTATADTVKINDQVVVLGNSGGGGVVTDLEGQIVGVGPDRLEVSAFFIPGNSGSPIIHLKSGRVVGIATYLMKRYDELNGDSGARRFGYRLDSVRNWEPVNWAGFHAEAEEVEKMNELTKDIFEFLHAIRGNSMPSSFRTAALQQSAEEWWSKIHERRSSPADRTHATQSFLGSLRSLVRGDVATLNGKLRYSYFREKLREESEVRDRLYKDFDSTASRLAAASAHQR
jgi:hypothetical protein